MASGWRGAIGFVYCSCFRLLSSVKEWRWRGRPRHMLDLPARRRRSLVDVELLLVEAGIRLDDDGALGEFFHLVQPAAVLTFEGFGDFRVNAQENVLTLH